jgi:hypothetical protein
MFGYFLLLLLFVEEKEKKMLIKARTIAQNIVSKNLSEVFSGDKTVEEKSG